MVIIEITLTIGIIEITVTMVIIEITLTIGIIEITVTMVIIEIIVIIDNSNRGTLYIMT